jgi:hypothetical protein
MFELERVILFRLDHRCQTIVLIFTCIGERLSRSADIFIGGFQGQYS